MDRRIVRVDTETVPDVLRKCVDRICSLRRSTAEIERYPEHADDDRDDGKRPNCSMRGKIFRVEHAKVTGKLFIATHRVSHPGTCVHAGQRRTDQGQKYRTGLNHHKAPTSARTTENPRPHNLHHVSDWRRRGRSRRRGIAAIKEKVRSEIFKEI